MPPVFCHDAVARILAADAPVLFLDTCAVLDLLRSPIRDSIRHHDIDAAHTLLVRAEAQPQQLVLIVNQQTSDEFTEHVDKVEEEAAKELQKLTEKIGGILTRMRAFPTATDIPATIDLTAFGFPGHGRNVADRIMRTGLMVEDSDGEYVKAVRRVQMAAPPATRGKQSVKDCLITETYLRIAAELTASGFRRNKVFITSNKVDYEQNHSSLHPALRQEFSAAALEYAPSWSAARHEIDRA
ncbi:hypothetical protein M2352_003468 [Azospirillum fermentarium]|uniref:PIN domain-containing protein n=1 Tax=Azospirillum fermentarium TaxID=1233114 RepID=UPI002225B94A|nr:PIN domain-containing protein [Azospirillum fermentarium]MCW2247834.1 hypothetical protein [Azospirillum fermentarium]